MRGSELWGLTLAPPAPFDAHYATRVTSTDATLLVGTIDGQIVGYGTARVETLRDGRRLGIVDEVFVEEPAREVGVGEVLLDALCEWVIAAGCVGIGADGHYGILAHRATLLNDPARQPVAGDDASDAAWVALGDVARLDLVDGLAEFLAGVGVLDGRAPHEA